MLGIVKRAQFVLGQITRDIKGAMVHNYNSTPFIPFDGQYRSVLFMSPVDNGSAVDLCELGYVFDSTNKRIQRHFVTFGKTGYNYPAVVNYNADQGNRKRFADHVSDFWMQYYEGGSWNTTMSVTDSLPDIVEVNLEIQGEYPDVQNGQRKRFSTWIYLPNNRDNGT